MAMKQRICRFRLTGRTELLMHRDDVESADELAAARKAMPKGQGVKGDDRSPAWSWLTYVYHDGEHFAVEYPNLMASLRWAGAKVTLKKSTSCKSKSQSGLVPTSEFFELRTNTGAQVPLAPFRAARDEPSFTAHMALAIQHGFRLDMKRLKVGQAKHVRIRPCFAAGWTVTGELIVVDPELTNDLLERIFEEAGKGGLMDWRPSSNTPGRYGIYEARIAIV